MRAVFLFVALVLALAPPTWGAWPGPTDPDPMDPPPVLVVFDDDDPAIARLSHPERDVVRGRVRRAAQQALWLCRRPEVVAHFQERYGMDPRHLLGERSPVIRLETFRQTWRDPPGGRNIQVGSYAFGETQIVVNIQLVMAGESPEDVDEFVAFTAGVILHELAHLADFLDDGVNNDGGLDPDLEEGVFVQRLAGRSTMLPQVIPSFEEQHRMLRRQRGD